MTDQPVTVNVGAIVAQVRDLRAEIDRVKQGAPHPDEWPDEWVMHDHRAADQRQAELRDAILGPGRADYRATRTLARWLPAPLRHRGWPPPV
jgi:hypothetical protein